MPVLDPDTFVTAANTLYLLSKDSGGAAAPLVAALTDRVLRAGERLAEARGGRLDPPLVAVLDEAASSAPIRDLPKLRPLRVPRDPAPDHPAIHGTGGSGVGPHRGMGPVGRGHHQTRRRRDRLQGRRLQDQPPDR